MRRRQLGLGGLALVFIGVGCLVYGLPIVAIASAAPGLALLTYAECAKCPHCGKKFARRGLFHNSFTRTCLNCGVELGTPKATV